MAVSYSSIIPCPRKIEWTSDVFILSHRTVIDADQNNNANAQYLQNRLSAASGYPFLLQDANGVSGIVLRVQDDRREFGKEGYCLEISADTVKIEALTSHGVFNGMQTLLQTLPPEIESPTVITGIEWNIPGLRIVDQPRFPWRGFMLDEGRHFHGKETVLDLLDVMAALKMNVFHWHLTDDQGWRIQIQQYPRLTGIGSQRVGTAQNLWDMIFGRHDSNPHSGYYTQDEIREIVAYAADRYISVVPEVEMPGHSKAALAAYPEFSCTAGDFEVPTRFGIFKDIYCPGKEATFTFLQNILDEVVDMFPGPHIHIGGDEAPKSRWKRCPDCQRRILDQSLDGGHGLQTYFTNRIAEYLAEHGRTIVGWNEALSGDLHQNALIQYWLGNRKRIIEAIKDGRRTIISSFLDYYLDHSYSLTPLDRIYGFEPVFAGLDLSETENIIGVEALLWSEFVPNRSRLDFQVFPRLLAVAETGWVAQNQKDFPDFWVRLADFERRLDYFGVYYASKKDVQPPWFKRLFGLLTIAQPQRKTADRVSSR